VELCLVEREQAGAGERRWENCENAPQGRSVWEHKRERREWGSFLGFVEGPIPIIQEVKIQARCYPERALVNYFPYGTYLIF
jgi:hypothetical protein